MTSVWGGYLDSFSGKPTALNAMGASPGRSERVVMAYGLLSQLVQKVL